MSSSGSLSHRGGLVQLDITPGLSTSGYVYFAQPAGGGPIKIGYSGEPYRRVAYLDRRLKPGAWLRIIGLEEGGRQLERDLHERWAAHRILGEWFRPSPEILDHLARLSAANDQARLPTAEEAS